MKYKNLWGILSLSTLLLASTISCKNGDETPNVDDVKIDLTSNRLDRGFAEIDTNNIAASLEGLYAEYPEFLNFYLDTIMGFQVHGNYSNDNPGIQKGVRTFLTYPDFRNLFDSIAMHYPDTKETDADIKKGFQYLKYYYPNHPIPQIIYLNSNLNNYAAFTYDTLAIGIGLDMYLGENYPFYKSVGLPDYIIARCTEEYIPVNVFRSIYTAKRPFVMDNRTLLDLMIQKGKEQYFLSKVIPFIPEHLRMGFTQKQLEWCEASEASIYNFLIDKQLLYSTNLLQVARYITDGPTSAGMPPESPGSVGSWIGFRIIKTYAEKHPEKSLEEILEAKDPQRILQRSKYKPK